MCLNFVSVSVLGGVFGASVLFVSKKKLFCDLAITYEVRTFALAFGPQGGSVKAEEIFERMTEEGNSARSGAWGGYTAL